MTAPLDRPIGALVADMPQAADVLDALGIDYSFEVERSLAQACKDAGVDPSQAVAALERAPRRPATDWRAEPIGRLIDHLVDHHHAHTRDALAHIADLAAKACQLHGPQHPELGQLERELSTLREDLLAHLLKEEEVLFPCVRSLASDAPRAFRTVAHPVAVLMHEHHAASYTFATIRTLTGGFTPTPDEGGTVFALFAALEELELELHHHMHLETNVLFPRALALEESLG